MTARFRRRSLLSRKLDHANKDGIALGQSINTHVDLLADLDAAHPITGPILIVGAEDTGEDAALPTDIEPFLARHGIC